MSRSGADYVAASGDTMTGPLTSGDYFACPVATVTPQPGVYMNGCDILGVRNIQGGSNLAVLGAAKWNLDAGAGTSTGGQRGNFVINYDIGRGFLVCNGDAGGEANELLAINKTADNIAGSGLAVWRIPQTQLGVSVFIKNAANTATHLEIGTSGIRFWDAALTQTAVGAAGAAAALPATPKKYLKFLDTDGSVIVVPAYAAV